MNIRSLKIKYWFLKNGSQKKIKLYVFFAYLFK